MQESTNLVSPVALLTTDARAVEDHFADYVSGGGCRATPFLAGVHCCLIEPQGALAHRAVAARAVAAAGARTFR